MGQTEVGKQSKRDGTHQFVTCVFLFIACMLLYSSNLKTTPFNQGYDTIPARLIPFSILKYHSLTMDPFTTDFAAAGGYRGYVQEARGHLVSYYPIGTPIVALPFFLPDYVYLKVRGEDSHSQMFEASQFAEKRASCLIAALSVVMMFLCLLWITSFGNALVISVVYAAGTSIWAIGSQLLWQHGAATLCLTVAILLLLMPDHWWSEAGAGLMMGLCFLVRPQTFVFAIAVGVYLIWSKTSIRNRLAAGAVFSAAVLPSLILEVIYNLHFYGNVLGGYSMAKSLLGLRWTVGGLLGLGFSPNRGLLVFMPVCLVGVLGIILAVRNPSRNKLIVCLASAAGGYLLFHASFRTWAGGWSFGPRYLTETLPVLALASPAGLILWRRSRIGIASLLLMALWSITVQVDGAYFYPASAWNSRMEPRIESAAWDTHHLELWEDFLAWRKQLQAATQNASIEKNSTLNPYARVGPKLPPQSFRVEWTHYSVPKSARPGQSIPVSITIRNASPVTWPDRVAASPEEPTGPYAVRLSYRWISNQTRTDYHERVDLSSSILPGHQETLSFSIIAPPIPGEYHLQFDLVQEYVTWFESQGAETLVVPVEVR